jgi:hypothetical protein
MLWYKAWLDTRWRFLVGLGVLVILACGTVYDYLAVERLMPMARAISMSGELGRRLREAVDLEREFRGFVWLQWFKQNLSQAGTLLAVLLGSGSLLSTSARGALFTLSLPVTRRELLMTRAAIGLAEWLALAMVPSLLIPLLAPVVGQSYSVVDSVVHAFCVFVVGGTFFGLAFLLSTIFDDLWRPLLIACAVAVVLNVIELAAADLWRAGIFHVMSAESYFRSGTVPWAGLLLSTLATAAMLYAATNALVRRDF